MSDLFPFGQTVVTGTLAPDNITLNLTGGGKIQINLAHANTWTAAQNIIELQLPDQTTTGTFSVKGVSRALWFMDIDPSYGILVDVLYYFGAGTNSVNPEYPLLNIHTQLDAGTATNPTIIGFNAKRTGTQTTPQFNFNGTVNATKFWCGSSAQGVSGSFTTADGKTVTVTGGIITAIV